MRAVSLFAGIGGFDLGLERSGFTITHQVEREPFCQRVLAARFPHATCWPDVREWTGDGHESVDLLCGGFPCQDLSVAGKRKGLSGERSGLFREIVRIATAIKPTWGLFENVPGLFSAGGGHDMASVLEGLRQCWPVVGYRVLDSRYWGVPQRRRRVFFVCGPSIAGVEQILFDSTGSGGDSSESQEARPDIARSLRSRSSKPGINPPGRGGEDDMNLVCAPLTCRPYGDQQGDESKLVAVCLNSGGFRTEPGEHLVPIAEVGAKTQMGGGRNGCGIGQPGDPMFTLQAGKQHAVGVRRLTPTECERLQGFPDGWTCLCMPIEQYDSNRCRCSDGARYKALGNAVTVNVIEWIGKRIMGEVR